MKQILGITFVFTAFFINAQNFNIDPIIRDSINSNTFNYHVSGIGQFGDSLIIHAELITEGDVSETLFSGMYDFSNPSTSTLTNFTFNPTNTDFSFGIGNFPTGNLFLHMWIVQNGEMKNEIYYKQ